MTQPPADTPTTRSFAYIFDTDFDPDDTSPVLLDGGSPTSQNPKSVDGGTP